MLPEVDTGKMSDSAAFSNAVTIFGERKRAESDKAHKNSLLADLVGYSCAKKFEHHPRQPARNLIIF